MQRCREQSSRAVVGCGVQRIVRGGRVDEHLDDRRRREIREPLGLLRQRLRRESTR